MTQDLDITSSKGDPQSTAITTLTGVVTYLIYELASNGNLNVQNFRRHLDDLSAPDSPEETEAEKRMRAALIKLIWDATKNGVEERDEQSD